MIRLYIDALFLAIKNLHVPIHLKKYYKTIANVVKMLFFVTVKYKKIKFSTSD